MVTLTRPQHLTLPPATVAAAIGGGMVALACLIVPSALLEAAVLRTGLPALLAAAAPPLGITARIALALLLGGTAAGLAWLAARRFAADRPVVALDALAARLRRGDVHPDGPPRPPLFAHRDLGTPFMGVHAQEPDPAPEAPFVRDLPADLDQPMAAFDPAAIPDIPLPAPEPVAALRHPQLIDPGDRFETFELTPIRRADADPVPAEPVAVAEPPPPVSPRPAPQAVVAPETESTVHALLARLERGLAQREQASRSPGPIRTGSLQDTLGDLRQLATGRP